MKIILEDTEIFPMLSDVCIRAPRGAKYDEEIQSSAMDDAHELVRVRKIRNFTIPWGTAEWLTGMEAEFKFLKLC